jgi:O-succinylbenzoate synthase
MMHIDQITLREIQLPLKEPFTISTGTQYLRRIILAESIDADGTIGWGECVADESPNYLPETTDVAWLSLTNWIVPLVVGRSFDTPRDVHPLLDAHVRGHHMAKAAIEMGVWELAARQQHISLSELLGGTRRQVPVGVSIGIHPSPDALVAKARHYHDQGYRKIKLKIKPGADVAFVAAVREALPGAALMVDANNAYTMDDLDVLKQLDTLGLMMIEQPLAWDDYVEHAELVRQLEPPICLDESISSPAQARDMIQLGSGRIINIKPGRVGGFTASLAIHDLCQHHGMPVWCGGMLESGIGRAHNVALASLPNFSLPGDLSPSSRYWERDVVSPPWTMTEDGTVVVPRDEPGMGVAVDRDRVEALTVRRSVLAGQQ